MYKWVSLHTHSQYSILQATGSVERLVLKAKNLGMEALALTDQDNLYGAVEFFKSCSKHGLKPIIGATFHVAPQSRRVKERTLGPPSHLVTLLAKNAKGYKNLCLLCTAGHLEGFYHTARIDKELLAECADGLICLVGGIESALGHALVAQGDEGKAQEELAWLLRLFKADLFFELARHPMTESALQEEGIKEEEWLLEAYKNLLFNESAVNNFLIEGARKWGVPLVASNKVHYIERAEWLAHEVLLNIGRASTCEIEIKDSTGRVKGKMKNPKRMAFPSHEYFLKSDEEMLELFSDHPEAVLNSCKIAQQCSFEFSFSTKHYPLFIPESLAGKNFTEAERKESAYNLLRNTCLNNISTKYSGYNAERVANTFPGQDVQKIVLDRLEYELSVVASKNMVDYLLVVWDFIGWAKQQGIPVGPGRGSGAGSIILFLSGITEIEPLQYHLFFERFISLLGTAYPDIDSDFCMLRRDEVIQYTMRKYGSDRVAQIITFGSMRAKMAIKDVGRVLSVPLAKVNLLTKAIPEEPGITLEKALEQSRDFSDFYTQDPEIKKLIDLAKQLEGTVRNTGIHAAGVVIAKNPLVEHLPLCSSKDAQMSVTQFSMKSVESIGLLKMDFLGLKTLTTIAIAFRFVEQNHHIFLDWHNIPVDDRKTYEMLQQGKALGVFQLESGGMQELLQQLRVDKFEELIAVLALYRPGPMEMIPTFIKRKMGQEPIHFDHPLLEPVLQETYGIMVYQEQAMQVANVLAGYSLAEGDVLRRAMGKKDKEEMARQKPKFLAGALSKGIDVTVAENVFALMEKFAAYGFNKSHATAYARISYVAAFLKANYPAEWMSALLSTDKGDLEKVARLIRESKAMGILVLPPDLNESTTEFIASREGIRFALDAIKGIGTACVEAILSERARGGAFASLRDFMLRVDLRAVGKKNIELLIAAGCFDFLGRAREEMIDSVPSLFDEIGQTKKEKSKGIQTFFDLLEPEPLQVVEGSAPNKLPLVDGPAILKERELLGVYLRAHPLDPYVSQLGMLSAMRMQDMLLGEAGSIVRFVGVVEAQELKILSKGGKKMAILTVGDGTESIEISVRPALYEKYKELCIEHRLLYGIVGLARNGGHLRFQAYWLASLEKQNLLPLIGEADKELQKAKSMQRLTKNREKIMSASRDSLNDDKSYLQISLSLEGLQMSAILALKELFQDHSGDTAVVIDFLLTEKLWASVRVESPWGIDKAQEALLFDRLNQYAWIQKFGWVGR